MFIAKCNNNGAVYLSLGESRRVKLPDGRVTVRKKILLNLGPLTKLTDGKPDYLERLRASFREGKPLLDKLKPFCQQVTPPPKEYRVVFRDGEPECSPDGRLCCNLLLETILEELGLPPMLAAYKSRQELSYDLYGFFKLLVFNRLLHPASKCGAVRDNGKFYDPPLAEGFNRDNVYDTLDVIAATRRAVIRKLHARMVSLAGRKTATVFYDVTNFFFETEEPDEDIRDDAGKVIAKGLRKLGVSKEHRPQPIVQTGLFMDDRGIPVAFDLFPGNTLDHLTLKPALAKTLDGLGMSRLVLVADRGVYSGPNLVAVTDAGHGYIVSRSLLKSTAAEREWAYGDEGWVTVGPDFRYKSRRVTKCVSDGAGGLRELEQLVIVYWSRAFQIRAERENRSFLEFLEQLRQKPGNFRISALQAKCLRKFFKQSCLNVKTGEVIEAKHLRALIDYDQVAAYKRSLGYYQIVTSELGEHPRDIIDRYGGLTQIEEQFRIMKGALATRPVFVRTPAHIEAHLTVCFIALVMLRLIQCRVIAAGQVPKARDGRWQIGMPADRICAALNRWQTARLGADDAFLMLNVNPAQEANRDLLTILKACGVTLPMQVWHRGELKALKQQMAIMAPPGGAQASAAETEATV